MKRAAKGARKTSAKAGLYRQLPSVDALLRGAGMAALIGREGHATVTDAVQAILARMRSDISASQIDVSNLDGALSGLAGAVEHQVRGSQRPSLLIVINATGVILHTNLGRAPLPSAALDHMQEIGRAYSNLEFNLASGERGERDVHVDRLFRQLLRRDAGAAGASRGLSLAKSKEPGRASPSAPADISTIVVNNNAAAVLLALNTLAEGGEAIVSRGELVEIGGSFRIPEVMAKSHAILREVGSTNRTRLADYERAINGNTRILLRVHRSNFKITGFTEQPRLDELVRLARRRNLPLLEDLGSGALFDLSALGVKGEPGVLDSLRAGVDVVTYSGDKLLGGPQAGMLSGGSDLIARMRANSLFRALRVDKLTYAALEATLLAYLKHDYDAIPAVRMMRLSKAEISQRAEAMAKELQASLWSVELMDGESVIGGGAAPSATLPTRLLAVASEGVTAHALAARLRAADPPVIARVADGRLLFDLRTVFPEQDKALTKALFQVATE
jgi:L-seryl-tRNA(Ser) seleniumtransferase